MCKNRKALIQEFEEYRTISGKWNDTYRYYLHRFDRYCDENLNETDITQDIIDTWCAKHETESNASRNRRIQGIRGFIFFLRERDHIYLNPPELLHESPSQYAPHAFTPEELHDFFGEADRQVIESSNNIYAFRAITSSVLFRLLYSSGMRTTEARLLKVEDADLPHSILRINTTKANHRHFVALHDDTQAMLTRYNLLAEKYFPGRSFFFPANNGNCMQHGELTDRFQKIWKQISNVRAVPYDLRHNYAITNINAWTDGGFDFHDKFLYLSKSMGHMSLESTRYYYSLVPALADTIFIHSDASFDAIVPEVKNDEG